MVFSDSDTPARIISEFNPLKRDGNQTGGSSIEDFRTALFATWDNLSEGALTPHLFYDPTNGHAWGEDQKIEFGAKAWDSHTRAADKIPEELHPYGFVRGDERVIQTALSSDLLSKLPCGVPISAYSYGPGDLDAFQRKEQAILNAIIASPKMDLRSFTAIDILDRYAHEAARRVHETYNLHSNGVQGDFYNGLGNLRPQEGTGIVMAFGGSFANAPQSKERAGRNSKQAAAHYLANMLKHHGLGTVVMLTIDVETDENKLAREYSSGVHQKEFEAFVLSAFPRAVEQGIIKRIRDENGKEIDAKDWRIFDYWKLETNVQMDDDRKVVKLRAKCKKPHTLITDTNDLSGKPREFCFTRGVSRTHIVSNKWSYPEWKNILEAIGLQDIKSYPAQGSRRLVVGSAKRTPSHDAILALK